MNFTTLEKIKSHLRIDDDAEDDLLDSYIFAASSAVKNYLKSASPYALKLDDDFIDYLYKRYPDDYLVYTYKAQQ